MTRRKSSYGRLLKRAREFRRSPTKAEELLWAAIRGRQLGFAFRRQDPFCGFIADFRCPRCRLVVEVDGPIHRERVEKDAVRDRAMRDAGHEVLRFTNRQVFEQLESVLEKIEQTCRDRDQS